MNLQGVMDIPIFPLPRTVLMPGALLPLHVFEPRYRSLVQHCLAQSTEMGIATLKPSFEAEYYGAPPVHREVGIGSVVAHQGLADGRYNIVVRYVSRAVVVEELEVDELFRVVRCAPLPQLERLSSMEERGLRGMVMLLGGVSADVDREVSKILELQGQRLLHGLARLVLTATDQQRAYLGSDSTRERVRVVEERLAEVIAARSETAGEA